MGGLWAAIPLKWKVGIIGGFFGLLFLTAAITGSIAYMYGQAKDHERLACKAAVQDETIAAMEKAQKDIINEFIRQYEEEDRINAAPDADYNVMGDGLVDQLNRM